nr:MAG TPA: hypothetical protein [Caudoviricetes sp.]
MARILLSTRKFLSSPSKRASWGQFVSSKS